MRTPAVDSDLRPRRFGGVLGALTVAVLAAAVLAGCTASPDPASDASSESPSPTATSDDFIADGDARPFPDGASADTPECQPVSAAALAAVNATIDASMTGGATAVTSLTASPDPDHAVWLLTGAITSTPGSEPYLVSWATTGDPTQDAFDGMLRSVGGVTGTISTAPLLQFPDAEPGGLPVAALRCVAGT